MNNQGLNRNISLLNFLNPVGININAFEEPGSDNTVRYCAANLNMKAIRLNINEKLSNFSVIKEINDIPIYHYPKRSHFGSKHGILAAVKRTNDPVYVDIKEILSTNRSDLNGDNKILPATQNYLMLVIRVTDQLGNPVADYIPNFYCVNETAKKNITVEHKHENSQNKEIDAYYIKYKNFSKIEKFGFQILKNEMADCVYEASETIDLYWPEQNIYFLEERKTHLINIKVKKIPSSEILRFSHLNVEF